MIIQLVILAVLSGFLIWAINNAIVNLNTAGISSGFGFLDQTAGFDIAQTLVPYDRNSTYSDAFVVGLLNTLLVSAIAIVLSTFLGFVIGVFRLSDNFLLRNLASVYIGSIRNFPLLLQILFWYIAVLSPLPSPKNSYQISENWFLSNRGIIGPMPMANDSTFLFLSVLTVALILCVCFIIWSRYLQRKTGQYIPAFMISIVMMVVLFFALYFYLNTPFNWNLPVFKGFNFQGGFTILPELIAIIIALSFYASAFIAENVRAGIVSVDKGQSEAALSLSLKKHHTMRLIVIPQALRIIIPPLTSQHLTTVKTLL